MLRPTGTCGLRNQGCKNLGVLEKQNVVRLLSFYRLMLLRARLRRRILSVCLSDRPFCWGMFFTPAGLDYFENHNKLTKVFTVSHIYKSWCQKHCSKCPKPPRAIMGWTKLSKSAIKMILYITRIKFGQKMNKNVLNNYNFDFWGDLRLSYYI